MVRAYDGNMFDDSNYESYYEYEVCQRCRLTCAYKSLDMCESCRQDETDDFAYTYDDYYDECPRCDMVSIFKDQKMCETCKEVMTQEELDEEYSEYETKAARRDVQREKARYGPVRHLPGDFHPPKIRIRIR